MRIWNQECNQRKNRENVYLKHLYANYKLVLVGYLNQTAYNYESVKMDAKLSKF